MPIKRSIWVNLALINLSVVALLGFGLRSKILFPVPFIEYRNLLSAHSHFAFGGWVGFAMMILLIYDVLPQPLSARKRYQWILAGIEISSLGMVVMFPFYGYNAITLFFSTLYIAVAMVFAVFFIKDVLNASLQRPIKLLSISAIVCLVLSFLGTLGLAYILLSRSGNSLLYRNSIYTFLHFQYNGFFTLAIFAHLLNRSVKQGTNIGRNGKLFAINLCISIIPTLFLSLLWHNSNLFYVLAGIGCIFIFITLYYFFRLFRAMPSSVLLSNPVARAFLLFAVCSFALKMLLNAGTVIPQLGNAVYGDRPVIIGFLHLVFLGFCSFYLLGEFIDNGYFNKRGKLILYPFVVFAGGIFANELLLMLQGLGILFKTNSDLFKWFLWAASILLFIGATLIVIARFSSYRHSSSYIRARTGRPLP
jgi:hypothetical protein